MPRMYRCSFCGKDFRFGTGIMYVKSDGTVYWFCSSKCRKSQLKLGRDARKLKWAKRKGKGRAS